MKSSRAITLTLLSASMLTACCCAWPGSRSRHVDYTWYDSNHKPIEEQWTTDADGHRVPAVTPYDNEGRPWVKDANGEWHPQESPTGTTHSTTSHTTHHRTSFWPLLFSNSSGSGYRSSSSNYSSSGSNSQSGTRSSVTRGGFGSTASSISSSGS